MPRRRERSGIAPQSYLFAHGLLGKPALPDPPQALVTAEGWVAWVFPVGTVLQILGFTLAVFLLWQLVAIGLRWAKALD